MRGFFFTTMFFALFMLTLFLLANVVAGIDVPQHPRYTTHIIAGNTGPTTLKGVVSDCYYDINTFGDLNKLDGVVDRPC